jgi:flavin reductase (DIM6/NTAB) family NADH-FMN oxidoreductase RutF
MMKETLSVDSVSSNEYRELMGRFATGVTVVTAVDAAGDPGGMTASAVSGVSLDPPLLLVCVNHDDPFHAALSQAPWFAINVLASDQEAMSRRFAGAYAARFSNAPYRKGPEGLPLLNGAVAHLLCERWQVIPAGDHTIFLGRVTGGSVFEQRPLLHYRGRYTSPTAPE